MADTRFHGVRVYENTDLVTAINDIDTSVIGIVAVADDADEGTFPINKPVLLTRVSNVLGKAGRTGTLYKSLKAISDQISTKVIVVRVAAEQEGDAQPTQSQLLIGTVESDGSYTGMQALLIAEQDEKIGVRPRILAAPGFNKQEVTTALAVVAKKLRAFVYAGCPGCNSVAEAVAYRASISSREVMLVWPDFVAFNPLTGQNETFWAPAYACGVRARIDHDMGWHKSLSNVDVDGVLGISVPVFWSLQAEDSDAETLNDKEITTLIKRDGKFRFWGNRTLDTDAYIFETYTRTSQFLADTIAESQFRMVDTPLTPSNVKDVLSGINAKLSALVTAGRLIGATCWYDVVDNGTTDLRQGTVRIRYKYTPVPPLENLELHQTFTDEFFASAFSALGGK